MRFDGEENPEEIKKVVDAVIEAYIYEVNYKELARSSETRERLKKLRKQLVVELEEKMDRFQNLSNELDSSDSAAPRLAQRDAYRRAFQALEAGANPRDLPILQLREVESPR